MRISDLTTTVNPLIYRGGDLTGVNLLKFLCAILVVQIHSFSFLKPYVMPLCRTAVPVFFIISGYFMVNNEGEILSSKIGRIFAKIFGISVVTSLIYTMLRWIMNMISPNWSLDFLWNPSFWILQFAFGDSLWYHLWYLVAYCQLLAIFYIALKTNRFKVLFFLAPAGLILNLILGKYSFLLTDVSFPIFLSRNILTTALPFVIIGIIIRYNEHRLPSRKRIISMLAISLICLYTEDAVLQHFNPKGTGDFMLFTLPAAILIFILFLKTNITPHSKSTRIALDMGKRHSLDIYIWHPMFVLCLEFMRTMIEFTSAFNTFIILALAIPFSAIFKPMEKISCLIDSSFKRNLACSKAN